MSERRPLSLTIGTVVCNAFPRMRECLASVLRTGGGYRFVLLDNGSDESMESLLFDELRPYWSAKCIGRPVFIRNAVNVGVRSGAQQVVERCETDLLAIIHNDIQITQPAWDAEVLQLFADDPKLGLVSFFGCPGVTADGVRGGIRPGSAAGWSNLVDAEAHGMRIKEPRAIAVPDAFAMILRRKMLERVGGFGGPQTGHYDVTIGLQSLAAGYHNMVAPIACQHLGGQTRRKPLFKEWVRRTFNIDLQQGLFRQLYAFTAKVWGPCLPLYVNRDFSFAETMPTGEPTGRNIVGYNWREQERLSGGLQGFKA